MKGALIRAAFARDPWLQELGGVALDEKDFMALARAVKLVVTEELDE